MSNQSQKSPLPKNLAEEEAEKEEDQQEEEDKKLQEPYEEPTGGGGDERKVANLPPCAQKTSIARKGPALKPCAANAKGSDTMREMITSAIYGTLASMGIHVPDSDEDISPEEEESISIKIGRAIYGEGNLEAKRLASKNVLASLPLPNWGTPAKRPLENSSKDGVSQGKEKMIKDKVHGEDGEEGEGKDGEGEGEGEGEGKDGEGEGEDGGEENPRDNSASI
ncbi:hypothetical protein FH972_020453 [Carpinus fangiana]|uniref:Uncharacterized protein n=1 Tax=Carpinus fangiana TaxID=176857 RepID=A0A5N6RXN4_9ROSI|nr:hypothetical protein FH972_020453 [Carpinus fangiana]